jgi:cysteine synthase A
MVDTNKKNKLSSLVDDHARAIKLTFNSLSSNERDLFMMQLRLSLHNEFPSAMGPPARIDNNIVEAIGQSNLVRLNKIPLLLAASKNNENENNDDDDDSTNPTPAEVVAKIEFTNPGGSVKDRIAREMIEDAERKGEIKPGIHTIVDVTSGNTGIGYGVVAAAKGYDVIQIIPEPYSVERRALMMALGVKVLVSNKKDGMDGALKIHREIMQKLGPDKSWAPRQFDNEANINAHFEHTGPEIWEQCGGKVDAIVAAYGTGGTLSGITSYLRSKNPNFKCIAVEPMEQSLLNGDKPGPHGIQGIAPSFLPTNVRVEEIDEVIRCPTSEAMKTARALAKEEGIAVGISAGANAWAASQVANRPEWKGKRIVTIFPSAAERYMSTELYESVRNEANNLPLSTFNPETVIEGQSKFEMHSLASHKEAGTIFRPGFKVH